MIFASPGKRTTKPVASKTTAERRQSNVESIEVIEPTIGYRLRQLQIELPDTILTQRQGSPPRTVFTNKMNLTCKSSEYEQAKSDTGQKPVTGEGSQLNEQAANANAPFNKLKHRIFAAPHKQSICKEQQSGEWFRRNESTVFRSRIESTVTSTNCPIRKRVHHKQSVASSYGASLGQATLKSSLPAYTSSLQKLLQQSQFSKPKAALPSAVRASPSRLQTLKMTPLLKVIQNHTNNHISPSKQPHPSRFKMFDHKRSLLPQTSDEIAKPERYHTKPSDERSRESKENQWFFKTKANPKRNLSLEKSTSKLQFQRFSMSSVTPKLETRFRRNCTSLERNRSLYNIREAERLVYAIRTRRGYDPDNCFKKNQDSYFAASKTFHSRPVHVFGVCDGHGKQGERISEFLTASFLPNLFAILKENEDGEHMPTRSVSSIAQGIEGLMYKALRETVDQLGKSDLDYLYSGSTFNAALIWNDTVYCCNVGDSRLIMLKEDTVMQLSEDHKPDNATERARIESRNGIIGRSLDQSGNHFGPLRVWAKGEDLPGLSLSRTVGDQAFENIGITWKPSFVIHQLGKEKKLIYVLGSDGLFEVLSNLEILTILERFWEGRRVEEACDALMEAALRQWRDLRYDSIDDITFIVMFSG